MSLSYEWEKRAEVEGGKKTQIVFTWSVHHTPSPGLQLGSASVSLLGGEQQAAT